ncbi:MAG: hypothetical protein ACI85I_001379 [Arenicella sp.]|jgi:hypothetical protein
MISKLKNKTKSRITSILKTASLDSSITALPTFSLSELELETELEFDLPTNLRLGHLAERIVSESIKSSSNYKMLYENTQLIEDKRTIGEIDFIIENSSTKQLTHVELAYKFYLFDPSISPELINNWIGPNRNDSLKEKLEKLKSKQFPLLYHNCAKSKFKNIALDDVSQKLCLLTSLFIPYKYNEIFDSSYAKAIKGFYLSFETFTHHHKATKTYYLPPKKEWGMNPSENETWSGFEDIKEQIEVSMKEKQAPLCWQKYEDSYLAFFIVWW